MAYSHATYQSNVQQCFYLMRDTLNARGLSRAFIINNATYAQLHAAVEKLRATQVSAHAVIQDDGVRAAVDFSPIPHVCSARSASEAASCIIGFCNGLMYVCQHYIASRASGITLKSRNVNYYNRISETLARMDELNPPAR